jgi:hypothetical protein
VAAYLELAGVPVIEACLRLPRVGVWRAEVVLDSETPVAGKVVLRADGGGEWHGTVRRSDVARGVVAVEVVGGAGGLARQLPPKTYRNMTVRVALTDLLRETGEQLSPSASAAVLDQSLPAFARFAGPASAVLCELLGPRVGWRILADGSFWVGGERWAPIEALELNAWAEKAEAELDVNFAVHPGSTVAGRRVSLVHHEVAARRLRTRVWFE